MPLPPPELRIALIVVAIIAGFYDIRFRRIPNWLNVAGLLTGFALNTYLYGSTGFRNAVLGMALAALVYIPLHALGAMSAGDVKLMVAIGSIAGWRDWLVIFLIASVVAAFSGMMVLMGRGWLGRGLRDATLILLGEAELPARHPQSEGREIPSATAVGLPHGAVIALVCAALLSAAAVLTPG